MPDGATFKAELRAGRVVCGCWIELFSAPAAEIVGAAGYDCAMIDLEHGAGSILDAQTMMQAMSGTACTPLVRVQSHDPAEVKRALDIGAVGIMVPGIGSVEEAEAAVAACHYPPRGIRGNAAGIVRASGYGADWRGYLERAGEETLVIGQIESRAGLDQVEAIAAVEGLDMLFVGPFDLSSNLGHLGQPDHSEAREGIARVEAAAKKAGKLLGNIPTPERGIEDLLAAGYSLVMTDADSALLRLGAEESVARFKAALEK